jgi:GMP synthase PP-ATPase subunit
METISNQIVNSIRGINRVVYDITTEHYWIRIVL